MERPLSKKQALAVIEAIIVLNARLVGEEPDITVRGLPKGWIRIAYLPGKGRRATDTKPREYPDVQRALAAAWKSLARARAWNEGRDDYMAATDEAWDVETPAARS